MQYDKSTKRILLWLFLQQIVKAKKLRPTFLKSIYLLIINMFDDNRYCACADVLYLSLDEFKISEFSFIHFLCLYKENEPKESTPFHKVFFEFLGEIQKPKIFS